jgi:hypothetical protein
MTMMKDSFASTALIYRLSFISYAFLLLQTKGKIVAATVATPNQEKSRKVRLYAKFAS